MSSAKNLPLLYNGKYKDPKFGQQAFIFDLKKIEVADVHWQNLYSFYDQKIQVQSKPSLGQKDFTEKPDAVQ